MSGGKNPKRLIGNSSPYYTNVYTTTSDGYLIEGYYDLLKAATPLEGAAIDISLVAYGTGVVNS